MLMINLPANFELRILSIELTAYTVGLIEVQIAPMFRRVWSEKNVFGLRVGRG